MSKPIEPTKDEARIDESSSWEGVMSGRGFAASLLIVMVGIAYGFAQGGAGCPFDGIVTMALSYLVLSLLVNLLWSGGVEGHPPRSDHHR